MPAGVVASRAMHSAPTSSQVAKGVAKITPFAGPQSRATRPTPTYNQPAASIVSRYRLSSQSQATRHAGSRKRNVSQHSRTFPLGRLSFVRLRAGFVLRRGSRLLVRLRRLDTLASE